MADLRTRYMGLSLRNPIIVGSSGLTNSVDKIKELEKMGAGAVVLKSLFEEQIRFQINHSVTQSESIYSYPEAEDYIGNYTKESNVSEYLDLIRKCKSSVSIPIIASVNCVSSIEWTNFAQKIQEAGADALELNIFILPSDPKRNSEQNEQVYFDIAMAIIKQISIPVALKISYYFSSLTNTALKLSWTGIKGMVLFNRFYSPDIDIDKFEVTSSHVLSSPDEISTSLRWVAMLSDRLHCDISASTGVHNGEGVIKQLLAGATAIEVVSAIYKHGYPVISEIINDISKWMDEKGYKTIDSFRGKMNQQGIANPAEFERVQFMRLYSEIV